MCFNIQYIFKLSSFFVDMIHILTEHSEEYLLNIRIGGMPLLKRNSSSYQYYMLHPIIQTRITSVSDNIHFKDYNIL